MKYAKLFVFAVGFLFLATSAFAVTPLLSQAEKYVTEQCYKTKMANETAVLCHLFSLVSEHDESISDLQILTHDLSTTVDAFPHGGSIAVFDANGQRLGSYMHENETNIAVFIPEIQRRAVLAQNGIARELLYYESDDCSGTAYLFKSKSDLNTNNVVSIGAGVYFASKIGATPALLAPKSQYEFSENQGELRCVRKNSAESTKWYEAEEVTLPFTEPIALPVYFANQ